jgi:hypothetical protein
LSLRRVQRGEHPSNLALRVSQRTRIVDDKIGRFDLFFVGNLSRHSPVNLDPRSLYRNSHPLSEALNALFRITGHNQQVIKTVASPRFENQRSLDNGDGVRISLSDVVHPLVFVLDNGWMDNLVQLLDAGRSSGARGESNSREPRPINGSIGIQNCPAKMTDNFIVNRPARKHQVVSNCVRLDQTRPQLDEHFADRRFAARDAAGESDS